MKQIVDREVATGCGDEEVTSDARKSGTRRVAENRTAEVERRCGIKARIFMYKKYTLECHF